MNKTLTLRAVVGGMLLGALLTPCNIYSGLKIGWSFNVSIIALLLATGFWAVLARLGITGHLDAGEANITQTAASSSANIISGGLVAPIPAQAMLSGGNMPLPQLVAWVFAVSFLGIWVAWYLRASLILRADLAFPPAKLSADVTYTSLNSALHIGKPLREVLLPKSFSGTVVQGITLPKIRLFNGLVFCICKISNKNKT